MNQIKQKVAEIGLPDDIVKSLGEVSWVLKNYKRMALKA